MGYFLSVRQFLDLVAGPAALIDRWGAQIEANAEFQDVVANGSLLSLGPHRRIQFASPLHERFTSALARATVADGEGDLICIQREKARLNIGITPLQIEQSPYALLTLISPGEAKRETLGLLRRTFGLTLAEARLAVEMADGGSVQEAAKCRGVTWATARNQLIAITHKMGIRRQAELVASLGDLAPRLRLGCKRGEADK